MRKPVYAVCEQQRRRSACTSTQSDQHLCCSLLISKISSLYLASVAAQASLCLTWWETPKTGFLMMMLKCELNANKAPDTVNVTRKPVFAVCDQVRRKPVCAAIEAS